MKYYSLRKSRPHSAVAEAFDEGNLYFPNTRRQIVAEAKLS